MENQLEKKQIYKSSGRMSIVNQVRNSNCENFINENQSWRWIIEKPKLNADNGEGIEAK